MHSGDPPLTNEGKRSRGARAAPMSSSSGCGQGCAAMHRRFSAAMLSARQDLYALDAKQRASRAASICGLVGSNTCARPAESVNPECRADAANKGNFCFALRAAEAGIPLTTNHDCFGCLAGDAADMNQIIRREFFLLHRFEWLARLHAQNDPDGPPPPHRGWEFEDENPDGEYPWS